MLKESDSRVAIAMLLIALYGFVFGFLVGWISHMIAN